MYRPRRTRSKSDDNATSSNHAQGQRRSDPLSTGDDTPTTGVAIHDGALFRFDAATVSIQKIRDLTEEELAAINAYTTLVEFFTANPPKTNTRTRG